jgi:hypothetical protein
LHPVGLYELTLEIGAKLEHRVRRQSSKLALSSLKLRAKLLVLAL